MVRTLVATVVGNVAWVVCTVALAAVAVLIGWIGPRGHLVSRIARLWSWCLVVASGLRLDVRFEEPLKGGEGGAEGGSGHYVYMSNHQSMYDIPVLLATLPTRTQFLAKASLFRIPLFGQAIKVGGFVPVERGDRVRGREAFEQAVERIVAGNSILVFPEETRSRDGDLLPFKKGGVLLALKSGLPVVPVGIRGTREVRGKGSILIRPRTVEVRYGRPLDLSGHTIQERTELTRRVRQRVAELAGVEADGG